MNIVLQIKDRNTSINLLGSYLESTKEVMMIEQYDCAHIKIYWKLKFCLIKLITHYGAF